MPEPFMVYFGPYRESGHYFFTEEGVCHSGDRYQDVPWTAAEIDGSLQPGRVLWRDHWTQRGPMREGEALLHHKDGWTALSLWDSSVDTRPGSSSTCIAKGTFNFEEMVALARERFTERWNRLKFEVKLCTDAAKTCPACKGRGGIPVEGSSKVHYICSPCNGHGYLGGR